LISYCTGDSYENAEGRNWAFGDWGLESPPNPQTGMSALHRGCGFQMSHSETFDILLHGRQLRKWRSQEPGFWGSQFNREVVFGLRPTDWRSHASGGSTLKKARSTHEAGRRFEEGRGCDMRVTPFQGYGDCGRVDLGLRSRCSLQPRLSHLGLSAPPAKSDRIRPSPTKSDQVRPNPTKSKVGQGESSLTRLIKAKLS